MAKDPDRKNYVLVVDYNGETDIFQLSYDTIWSDVAIMLQVKYEFDDPPRFTYLDDEDDEISLGTQDEFLEALKMCKKNDDVLHVMLRSRSALNPIPIPKSIPAQQPSSSIGNSQSPLQNGFAWASKAVKQAVHGIGQGLITISNQEDLVSMEDIDLKKYDTPQTSITTPSAPKVHNSEASRTAVPLESAQVGEDFPTSSNTVTKEPVYTVEDIEVATSFEDEVNVKMPMESQEPSTSKSSEKPDIMDSEMIQSIKEEVRLVINNEMSVLREELNTQMLQQIRNKQANTTAQETSDDSLVDTARSPKAIKREINQLRKEMKVAKSQKRLKKYKAEEAQANGLESAQGELRKVRKFAASFICENLLDGSTVGTGQQFTKYWVLKNEGSRAWDHKIKLQLRKETPSPNGTPVDPNAAAEGEGPNASGQALVNGFGPEKTSFDLPIVKQHETAVIAVRHTAPAHTCTYTSSWRLHRKGQPFGPKVWCSVSVVNHTAIPKMDSLPLSTIFTTEDEQSLVKSNPDWFRQRSHSQRDENSHEDELSNMLSFEMTDVGRDISNVQISSAAPAEKSSYVYDQTATISGAPVQQGSEEDKTDEPQALDSVEQKKVPAAAVEEQTEVLEELPLQEEQQHTEEREEFESIKSLGNEQQDEVKPEEEETEDEEKERNDVEDRLRDEQFSATSSSSEEDASSEVSDFEVIPLPECFDMTRPLSGSERGDRSTATSLTSTGARSLEAASANLMQDVAEPPKDQEELMEQEPEQEEEEDMVEVVPPQADEDAQMQSSDDRGDPDAANNEEDNQEAIPHPTTSSSDVVEAVAAPKPVPQSVLDMNQPHLVQDYSQGYHIQPQMVVAPTDPWTTDPIALPRSVVNQDEPWSPAANSAPVPQPRAYSYPHPPEDRVNEPEDTITVPVPDPAVPEVQIEEDEPQILYPPQLGAEDANDEFHLAPQGPEQPPVASLPYNPSPIELLIEMGFTDLSLNQSVLSEFEGDVNRAVQALVYREEAEQIRASRPRGGRMSSGGGFFA